MKSKGSDKLSIQIKQGRIKFRMTVPFIEEIQDPNFSYKVYRDTYKEKYINNTINEEDLDKIYEIIDSTIPLKKRDLLELNKKLESLQQEYETRIQKEDPNLVSEDITNRMKDLVENKNGKHI